jgi:hypothetical protein
MSIKEQIRVLLYPINTADYERHDAENIEGSVYTIEEIEMVLPDDVEYYTLSEFMDKCNNEEIELDNYWVSYIVEVLK